MKRRFHVVLVLAIGWLDAQGLMAAEPAQRIDDARVQTIAGILSDQPTGLGRPIEDRAAWERLLGGSFHKEVIKRAEGYIDAAIPDLPDELYLEFSRTGNRTHYERVCQERYNRVKWLTLAEGLENRGRFLPALNALIRALCAQRTWLYPAHDSDLANFRSDRTDIDLLSSRMAAELATVRYLLGDRLEKDVGHLIEENIRNRVLIPFEDMVKGRRPPNWWFRGTNNWNAVCLAGVTVTALTALDSRAERALYIAAAEHYSNSFLRGFTADGYCSEGIGYWGYGFGHYLLLAEMIFQATGGKIDLLSREGVVAPARYGFEIEIINGVYPPFSDCAITARPEPLMMNYLSRRFGFGFTRWEIEDTADATPGLCHVLMYAFANSASTRPAAKSAVRGLGPRIWFDQAGVLICRPGESKTCRLAVALKGGHNAEEHNHNDVGSYVVVLGDETLLIDPGAEVYTRRTFSPQRYESNLLNSYGHPVPRVAGQLQRKGREACGRVVYTEFTDDLDTVTFDMKSAYEVAALHKLERTFTYSRRGDGSFTVTDEVEFSEARSFETALITTRPHEVLADGSVKISGDKEAVRVIIGAQGGEHEIAVEEIKEEVRTLPCPTRLAIRLLQPVVQAKVTMHVVPDKKHPTP